jgi:hypothetical protein
LKRVEWRRRIDVTRQTESRGRIHGSSTVRRARKETDSRGVRAVRGRRLTVAIVTSQARSGPTARRRGHSRGERGWSRSTTHEGSAEGRYRGAIRLRPDQCGSLAEPRRVHFDGRSEVQTEDGRISFSDSGAIGTVGRGNLAYLSTITDGSGEWEGATGQLLFRGFFNSATGRGKSDYVGKVCDRDDD